jgi:hypothetical protein
MRRPRILPELRVIEGGKAEPDTRTVVLCKPRRWGPAAVRSYLVHCSTCRDGVWLSVRAPRHDMLRILCTTCGLVELAQREADGADVEVEVAPWFEDDERARTAAGEPPTPRPRAWHDWPVAGASDEPER